MKVINDKKEKRARAVNYTLEECLSLIELVTKNKNVVECKKTDAVTWKEKDDAWKEIAVQFNAGTISPRTGEQLRNKFDSLKKETRKYCQQQRQEYLATGGGPYKECKPNAVYEKIKMLIQLSSCGLPSVFDSDELDTDNVVLTNEQDEKNMEVVQVVHVACLEEAVDDEAQIPFEEVSSIGVCIPDNTQNTNSSTDFSNQSTSFDSYGPGTSIQGLNWSTYSPAMLKKRHHPALVAAIKCASSNETEVGPKTTNCRLGHSNQATSSSNKTTSSHVPKSANGRLLSSLAEAKRDLAILQQELLRKEYNERASRESELHAQQLKIQANQLKIQENELEMQRQQIIINNMTIEEKKLNLTVQKNVF